MRYRGDGSFKPDDYELEQGLLELLNAEAECVDKINTAIRAYTKAKRLGLKTYEYADDIKEAKKELEEIRCNIGKYFVNKLNIER